MSGRRWPVADLVALTRHPEGRRLTLAEISEAAGLARGTLATWARRGGIPDDQADRLAVAVGLDPYVVWGAAWADAQLVQCAGCPARFAPTDRRQRYCSPNCSKRAWARRRSGDPAYRARRAEHGRAYYAQAGEYERAKKRREYWANPEPKRAAMRARRRAEAS